MRLTFTQGSSESGSISGDGIDWYWSGRHLEGPEETIEELGEAFTDRLKEQWPEVKEDEVYEIPAIAEIEWPEVDVLTVRLDFAFNHGALLGPEETKEEIQEYFAEPVEFADELVAGKNTAKVGGKTFEFRIDTPPK